MQLKARDRGTTSTVLQSVERYKWREGGGCFIHSRILIDLPSQIIVLTYSLDNKPCLCGDLRFIIL